MKPYTEPTCVYVLADDEGAVKIGASSDPEGRCRTLRRGVAEYNPRVAYIHHCPPLAREVERLAHAALEAHRMVDLEWFLVAPAKAVAVVKATARDVEWRYAEARELLGAGWSPGRVARRLKLTERTTRLWKDLIEMEKRDA